MNASRRKELNKLINELEDISTRIEGIKDEEQESFNNLPESLQYAEKGERMEEIISLLEDSISEIEDAVILIQNQSFNYENKNNPGRLRPRIPGIYL
jgi:uncharacterized protein YhaN